MKYKYCPPFIIQKLIYGSRWSSTNPADGSGSKILLTFDDGPNPGSSELILSALENNKLKAVMFCVGDNIIKYPELTNEMIRAGHNLANHTFNHKQLPQISLKEADEQIGSFNRIIEENHGYKAQYFRPPYGKLSWKLPRLLKKHNLKNVMWSLMPFDFTNDLTLVKSVIKKYLKKDSLINLHDSNKSKDIIVDTINFIIDEADRRGFKIGEPAECLR